MVVNTSGEAIFLDFQATTPLDQLAFEAMLPWMQCPYNAHATEHRIGRIAASAVDDARERVATLLGCHHSEITFTSGATEASNIVLRGVTSSGDTLAISAVEHASVMETANALGREGRTIVRLRVSDQGILDLHALQTALALHPALVSITAVNNEIGTVQPIQEAAQLCWDENVPFHCDMTQAVGRISVDFQDVPVTYASISSHKIYGPQGIGALFVRDGAVRPRPLSTGGGQEGGLRPGTLPVAACVGFGVACELAITQRKRDFDHARKLAQVVLNGLDDLDGWQVNGSLDERIPHNLSIAFEGIDAEVLLSMMPELAVSTGSACSSGSLRKSETLEGLGLPDELADGTIRIGFGRTTTFDEATQAATVLCERVRLLRRSGA